MSIWAWVMEQLRKDSQVVKDSRMVEAVGEHGVKVLRMGRPDGCVLRGAGQREPGRRRRPAGRDRRAAQAGMVIVTRRVVDPEVYDRARELDVGVDTFGGFVRAVGGFDDIPFRPTRRGVHPETDGCHKGRDVGDSPGPPCVGTSASTAPAADDRDSRSVRVNRRRVRGLTYRTTWTS